MTLIYGAANAEAQVGPVMKSEVGSARLTVTVRNEADSLVPNAEVIIVLKDREIRKRTDAGGTVRFVIAPDTLELFVRGIGYAERSHALAIGPGESAAAVQLRREGLMLGTVHTLADRPVATRYDEIDRRVRAGIPSDVVLRKDLELVRPVALSQVLRRMRGIDIDVSSAGTVATSKRGDAPGAPGSRCPLRVMVDGILMARETSLDAIPPDDVYAVELYLGPARLPVQFAGIRQDLWCGLIVITTRVQ